jgi:hypothetical protein
MAPAPLDAGKQLGPELARLRIGQSGGSVLLGQVSTGVLPGIAAFSESLYVYATATNGWSRQSQYDASATQAFVLVP